jgi:protein-L-isoaspartate(D-aspartate) O-methyltransferase
MNKERPKFPLKLDSLGPKKPTPSPQLSVHKKTAQLTQGLSNKTAKNTVFESPSGVGLDSAAVREHLIRKLAQQGIEDEVVLAAMLRVERHKFVDSALANQAYEDTSLPIGLGQTISKPNVVARMIELLRRTRGMGADGKFQRVLEIGTGCGYQAAVLSLVAHEVYSIERLKGLFDKAKDNLRPMMIPNLHLIFGDGMLGYAQGAPYSAIIAAAGGEDIPSAWLDQLAEGGRIVAPVVTQNKTQVLVVIDRTASGFTKTYFEPVHFVPLKSGIN